MSKFRHIARIAGGIALVIIGIVGLILPIMPGWIFVIPGLVLLSDYFPPIKRLLDWVKLKYEQTTGKKWPTSGNAPVSGEGES